jgi:hypothetical protein
MSIHDRPAKFGPYHRRSHHNPAENELIVQAGTIWGKPRGNYFAGIVPCVKAWDGPLPDGIVGIEFYTDVQPDPWSVPGWPEWSEGRPGVIVLDSNELVAIPVVVTMRRDLE